MDREILGQLLVSRRRGYLSGASGSPADFRLGSDGDRSGSTNRRPGWATEQERRTAGPGRRGTLPITRSDEFARARRGFYGSGFSQ
jgi:hypothetical protein